MAQPIEESILKLEPGLLLAWEKLTSLTTSKHYKDTNMWLNDEREEKKKSFGPKRQSSVITPNIVYIILDSDDILMLTSQ